MGLTNKGSSWEWMNSWYILLTFPMGFTSALAFFYTFIRTRKFTWLIASIFYAITIYGTVFALMQIKPPESGQAGSNIDLVIGMAYFGFWALSFFHAILIRKKYLLLLEARQESSEIKDDRLRTEIRAKARVLDNRVDEALIKFEENDITVKLCRNLFSALPFAPDFRYYFNLQGATERLVFDKNDQARIYEQARRIAREDDAVVSVLKVGSAIDTADSGLGIITGVRNVYSHMKDENRTRTFEADPQQAADAALKALGLAYMVSKLYDGGITEKVGQFFDSKAGQEIALYFAAAEIALPFTDNLLEGSGSLIKKLMEKQHDQSESKFSSFLGSGPLANAKPVLDAMTDRMDDFLGQVKMYTDPLMKKAQQFAPSVMNAADSVTGGLATATDFLPAWKFLTARLAAEACVGKAKKI